MMKDWRHWNMLEPLRTYAEAKDRVSPKITNVEILAHKFRTVRTADRSLRGSCGNKNDGWWIRRQDNSKLKPTTTSPKIQKSDSGCGEGFTNSKNGHFGYSCRHRFSQAKDLHDHMSTATEHSIDKPLTVAVQESDGRQKIISPLLQIELL